MTPISDMSGVIPCFSGWKASYLEKDGSVKNLPLVCWGIFKFGFGTQIRGLTAIHDVCLADELDGFIGYVSEHENPSHKFSDKISEYRKFLNSTKDFIKKLPHS